jgi:hypothetical protein
LDDLEREKKKSLLPGINPKFLSCPAHSIVVTSIDLS